MSKPFTTVKTGRQMSKVIQMADFLSRAVSDNVYIEGDLLPSINSLSSAHGVSRDTVFKAFQSLRERGIIDSAPGKGYFVKSRITNVLLLLDQYTPFKEALYNSMIKRLPSSYKIDLLFHQYNERLFDTILRDSVGRYNKYVVMNFDNEKFSRSLDEINPAGLLLLDFGKFEKEKYSYICQDFDNSFLFALRELKAEFALYKEIVFYFPKELKHPQSSKIYFRMFCEEMNIPCRIVDDERELTVEVATAYIAIKQQDVVKIVKLGRARGLKCGREFGLLAYNDIPSYEVIDDGITSISIDWEMMGAEVAEFVRNGNPVRKYLPLEVNLRSSL